jgi:micrococcal nuclease
VDERKRNTHSATAFRNRSVARNPQIVFHMAHSYRRLGSRVNKPLLLIAIGLALLVMLAAANHSPLNMTSSASPPLPTIVRGASDAAITSGEITVVDGDTIRAKGRTIRLVGFDAPESDNRASCPQERELAGRATARLRSLVSGGGLELRLVPCACPPGTEGMRECNYGRACGTLTAGGRDVGMILIAERLARPFVCGTTSCPRRQRWC